MRSALPQARGKAVARRAVNGRHVARARSARPGVTSGSAKGTPQGEDLRRSFLLALDGGKVGAAVQRYRGILRGRPGVGVDVFVDDLLRQLDQMSAAERDSTGASLVERLLPDLERRAKKPVEKALVKALAALAKANGLAVFEKRLQGAVSLGVGNIRLLVPRWRCWSLVQLGRWTQARAACGRARAALMRMAQIPRLFGVRTPDSLLLRLEKEIAEQASGDKAGAQGALVAILNVDPLDAVAARMLLKSSGRPTPKTVSVLLGAVAALRKAGRPRAALAVVTGLVSMVPRDARGWVERAECEEVLGKGREAVSALRRAVALDKGSVKIRLALARAVRSKSLLKAIRVLESAVAMDPTNGPAKKQLAKARAELAARRPKKRPARLTMIDGKRMRMWFTSHGGTTRALVLKRKKYRERGKADGPVFKPLSREKKLRRQVNLVRTWSSYWLPLRLHFVGSSFGFPSWNEDQDWERIRFEPSSRAWRPVREGETHAVRVGRQWVFGYRWPVRYPGMAPAPVVVERRYRINPDDSYVWDMEVQVTNHSDRKQRIQLSIQMPTYDRFSENRSFFNPISLMREAVCMVGDKVKMQTLPGLFGGGKHGCLGCDASSCACRRSPAKGEKESRTIAEISTHERWMNFSGRVRWIGVDEMYFLFALAPSVKEESVCTLVGRDLPGKNRGVLASRWVGPPVDLLKRGSTVTLRFKVFSGPKLQEELDTVRVGSADPKLGEAVDYGFFWVIGRPMMWLMKRLYAVVGNWGLAIILLTLLIKLLTAPLTMKQMRSMKGMAKLKPEMDALKEKYGDDKQRFQQEMWSLYKAHKINPLGGCLPMVIQLPIYVAWYQALMVSVDLYNAPLFGWIADLTKPDTVSIAGFGIPILPLLMGATMFLQQRMTPTTVDSAQQKMMMYMMPAMFTFFMLFLPSGLTLYILTNTVLTMLHQWYMNHSE